MIDERVNVEQTCSTSELGTLMRTYPLDRSNKRIETMLPIPLPGKRTIRTSRWALNHQAQTLEVIEKKLENGEHR